MVGPVVVVVVAIGCYTGPVPGCVSWSLPPPLWLLAPMVEEVVVEVVEVVCGSGRRESVRKFQHDKY